MKYITWLSLIIFAAGCGIRHEPASQKRSPWELRTSTHSVNPTPPAMYDAGFISRFVTRDQSASTGGGTTFGDFEVYLTFYNPDGTPIRTVPGDAIRVNGQPLADTISAGRDYRIKDMHFPQPVTWSVGGDGNPTFSHTMPTQQPVSIIAPLKGDSVEIGRPIEIRYSAPGADSLVVHLDYIADNVKRRDNKDIGRTKGGTAAYYWTANTGHFTIPPYTIDSATYKSFDPKSLFVHLFWDRGDTIHVDGKIFGFVSSVATNQTYGIKH